MSDLVGNPYDKFYHHEGSVHLMHIICSSGTGCLKFICMEAVADRLPQLGKRELNFSAIVYLHGFY